MLWRNTSLHFFTRDDEASSKEWCLFMNKYSSTFLTYVGFFLRLTLWMKIRNLNLNCSKRSELRYQKIFENGLIEFMKMRLFKIIFQHCIPDIHYNSDPRSLLYYASKSICILSSYFFTTKLWVWVIAWKMQIKGCCSSWFCQK